MRKPLLICLIGLPGLGKSTWRDSFLAYNDFNGFVASTDDIIDEWADEQGTTYNAIYHKSISDATDLWNKICHLAFTKKKDLLIDRTNMNKKTRDRYMRRARNAGYECRAIVFQPPVNMVDEGEWFRRLASRPGKTIPGYVLTDMLNKYEAPTPDEGFSLIGIVDTFTFPTTLQVTYDANTL
jgi:predicted kinase